MCYGGTAGNTNVATEVTGTISIFGMWGGSDGFVMWVT